MPWIDSSTGRFRARVDRGDGKGRKRYCLGTFGSWEEARLAEIDFAIWLLEQERSGLTAASA